MALPILSLCSVCVVLAQSSPDIGRSTADLERLMRGYGAVVFILGVGLAGMILLISVILARRSWHRRTSRPREPLEPTAYTDAWASASERYREPPPVGDEDEDQPDDEEDDAGPGRER